MGYYVPQTYASTTPLVALSSTGTMPRAFSIDEQAFMNGIMIAANGGISPGTTFAWGTTGATWRPLLSSAHHVWKGVFSGAAAYTAGDVVADAAGSKRLYTINFNVAASATLNPATGSSRGAWIPFGLIEGEAAIGATAGLGGTAGLVIASNPGDEASFLRGDGVWTAPATLVGAAAAVVGVAGIAPAPGAGFQNAYLRGDGTWAAALGATNGRTKLATTFNLTAAAGVYETSGVSIVLPAAGTYRIDQSIRSRINATPVNARIQSRLFNVTAGAIVADSELMGSFASVIDIFFDGQAAGTIFITVTAATTIRVDVARTGATWNTSQLQSNIDGITALSWQRIA